MHNMNDLIVEGSSFLKKDLNVDGNSNLHKNLNVGGDLSVGGSIQSNGFFGPFQMINGNGKCLDTNAASNGLGQWDCGNDPNNYQHFQYNPIKGVIYSINKNQCLDTWGGTDKWGWGACNGGLGQQFIRDSNGTFKAQHPGTKNDCLDIGQDKLHLACNGSSFQKIYFN